MSGFRDAKVITAGAAYVALIAMMFVGAYIEDIGYWGLIGVGAVMLVVFSTVLAFTVNKQVVRIEKIEGRSKVFKYPNPPRRGPRWEVIGILILLGGGAASIAGAAGNELIQDDLIELERAAEEADAELARAKKDWDAEMSNLGNRPFNEEGMKKTMAAYMAASMSALEVNMRLSDTRSLPFIWAFYGGFIVAGAVGAFLFMHLQKKANAAMQELIDAARQS